MLHIKHNTNNQTVERVFPSGSVCKHVGLSLIVEQGDEVLFLAPAVTVSEVYHDTEDTPEKSGTLFKSQKR